LFIFGVKESTQDDNISGAFRKLSPSHSVLVLRVINTIQIELTANYQLINSHLTNSF